MKEKIPVSKPTYSLFPTDIPGVDSLEELALNMRWSWNHAADVIWRQLDPELWELTHHPSVILQTVSRDRLKEALSNPAFREKVDALVQAKRQAEESPAWFQQSHPQSPLTVVAYFSMEFMLSEALPIYSGGLGNVAGDQLKAASDLGVPVTGIGLLYQQGYFRQVIDQDGAQQALYPYNDPGQLPVTPLRYPNGEWLHLEIHLRGGPFRLRVWKVQVGRVLLFLLDSNVASNSPARRGITSELYGGGSELRLQQEMILGMGGWRLLTALGIHPEVCHLNEGHAAFVVLERAHSCMEETGLSFEAALAVTRAGNLFTTHTAVAAGFDRFTPSLMQQYLTDYAEKRLRISLNELMALGRQNPDDPGEPFNMVYLAIRGSRSINAVSRLHGAVSRHLFGPLFARWPETEAPVGHVTNGVHTPTWDSEAADNLWTEASGKDRWLGPTEALDEDIRGVSDRVLWEMRCNARTSLVEYARHQLSRQLDASGSSIEWVDKAKRLFNPDVLTLGFARRFAEYKRPTLLLHDPERFVRILTNLQRPVQLILAGKAHPLDFQGQAMIQEWMRFIQRPEVRPHVIFLADYDMLITERLVQGIDIWLNTPRRPWEACGTSGMKVLVNGGLNLSELDGWWAEAYTPEVGWALGDGKEHPDVTARDAEEAGTLYDLLEREVIPEFYKRDENGIPTGWIAKVRESMARLTPQFSSNRAVREYTEKHYIPAATAYRQRSANKGIIGAQIDTWQRAIREKWSGLKFGQIKVTTDSGKHIFEVQVYLHELSPDSIVVELYADGINDGVAEKHKMKLLSSPADSANVYVYEVTVPATRLAEDYTARIIPRHEGVSVPLEAAQILWQK